MGILGRRSNDYRDDQVYNHQDSFENSRESSSKPIAHLNQRPLSELYGSPIRSFQTAPFEAYDEVTKNFLRRAGFNPLHLLDRVSLHLQYRENDTAAFALEVENNQDTLTHIILMDAHQALLRELGWYNNKQVAELAERVKGFKSPILRESTPEDLKKVFGQPLNQEQSQKIAQAFEKSFMRFYLREADLSIYRKNIGSRNAYAIHVDTSSNELCIERRTRLFSLTPAEEFLIQNEDEISLSHIQTIQENGLCRAPQYSWHNDLDDPSPEKRKELSQRIKETSWSGIKNWNFNDLKFKEIGKETLVWLTHYDCDTPGAFAILR